MKKTFDTVKMVREIRDKMHKQTKRMTTQELISFYRQRAKELRVELDRKKSLAKIR